MIDLFKVTSIVPGTKETLNNYNCLFKLSYSGDAAHSGAGSMQQVTYPW